MEKLLSVSDKGNVAIHALALAAAGEGRITAQTCAQSLGVSPSYLAKVLQILVHANFLRSTRGAAGGFELALDASTISCLAVLEAVDDPMPDRDCLFQRTVCVRGTCAIKVMCEKIAKLTKTTLESTTIAAVAASFK